ncbi:hypothetical protein MSAN_00050600 [Mycena sanguinolenta]|uniref:Uncharacterized protein n=1 Tax=Mycena sanguinolenta TaxID=230812 RepID=A0A8H6ZGA3_9AGAR|nr:hypothetical protein MSAN_00050600 [Mycena sanguinolenta]
MSTQAVPVQEPIYHQLCQCKISPQELVDRIIDHVASDLFDELSEDLLASKEIDSDWKDHYGLEDAGPELVSVASCGLVCKTWLPRTRFHLFSHTNLSNDDASLTDNLDAFLRLGDASPLPVPQSFIQFLDLDLLGGSMKDEDMRRLFNLPMLTSLRLRTPDDYDSDLDNFFAASTPHIAVLATNSPLLSSFHLDLNTDLPLPFLIHLVSNLPALEHLTIGKTRRDVNYDIVNLDSEVAPSSASFPPLRTLDLRLSCGAGLFFAWLLSLPTLPILGSLALALHLMDRDFPIEASLRPIEEYLRRAGRKLESFSLLLLRNFIDESDYSSIDHFNLERRWLAFASHLSALTFAPSQGASSVPEILSFFTLIQAVRAHYRLGAAERYALGVDGSGTVPHKIQDAAALCCGGCVLALEGNYFVAE